MTKKRSSLQFIIATVFLLLSPIAASAAIVVDQSQTTFSFGAYAQTQNKDFYQTFTAGVDGFLTNLEFYQNGNFTYDGTLFIREGTGRSGDILAATTANWRHNGIINVQFNEYAYLESGKTYTIDLTNSLPQWKSLLSNHGDVYSDGAYYNTTYSSNSLGDLWFQTFMEDPPRPVPVPSSLLLLGAGLLGFIGKSHFLSGKVAP